MNCINGPSRFKKHVYLAQHLTRLCVVVRIMSRLVISGFDKEGLMWAVVYSVLCGHKQD